MEAEALREQYDGLIFSAARRLKARRRRAIQAEVTTALCQGSPRLAERRFGWGRAAVATGLHEASHDLRCVENFSARGGKPSEQLDPRLADDIRAIVGPHTHADPEPKSTRRYANLSAREVLQALQKKGYGDDRLPSERTMRDVLDRMGYRLERIQKAKPLKKTKDTDAISDDVKARRERYEDDPESLEISIDTKAKVSQGDYSRGGKCRMDSQDQTPQGWDYDPPAKTKWTPFGVSMLASGALMTIATSSREASDFWADAMKMWWLSVRDERKHIKRLVIYLDDGPKDSGSRTQWLRRLIEFADWSGLEIRLVYYPPYHGKYDPIERCWSSLEKKWGGSLSNGLKAILREALRMNWQGMPPEVMRLEGNYVDGVELTKKEMKPYEARLIRSATLPKHGITIKPQ